MEGWRKGTSRCRSVTWLSGDKGTLLLLPLAGSPVREDGVREAVPRSHPSGQLGQPTVGSARICHLCGLLSTRAPSIFVSQCPNCRNDFKEGNAAYPTSSCVVKAPKTFVVEPVLPAGLASPPSSRAQHPLFLSTPHTRNANRVAPSLGQAVPGTRARPG